jgi:hypothetical protein
MPADYLSMDGLGFPLGQFLQSLLPDFILAFSFFTALTYAVLARRLEHQRPAIAMSGAVGLAMAMGLVWWEYDRGVSVRDLGSVAIGFGVILLGMLLFQGIRQTGGSWAGAGIAFGASILVGWILGTPWPVATGIIQSLAIVGLVVGIIAYLLHRRDAMLHLHPLPRPAVIEPLDSRHDMSDLDEDCRVGDRLRDGLHRLRKQVYGMEDHPEQANGVMQQIQKALPAEGWLTERLAQLRARSHLIREGHAHRLQELEQFISPLPHAARKQLSDMLTSRYQQVLGMDDRMERLDLAVAENERRVRELTLEARQALIRYDYAKLYDLLDKAEKLQKHNEKLLRVIERTEKKLTHLVQDVAQEAQRLATR